MIRRIDYLRNFGPFRDFQWVAENLTDFTDLNLLYGWNYSGKTSLSRVFRALESGKLEFTDERPQFAAVLDDRTIVTQAMLQGAPRVRVFNRDYVARNFSQETTAPSVVLLGEEHVRLKRRLEHLGTRRTRLQLHCDTLEKEHGTARSLYESLGTSVAREASQALGDRLFDRTKLFAQLNDVRPDPQSFTLSDDVVTARCATVKTGELYKSLPLLVEPETSLGDVSFQVAALLAREATHTALAPLLQSTRIEEWVRTGLAIHERTNECAFCLGHLSAPRLEELRGHFTQAYENLALEVGALEQEVEATVTLPSLSSPDSVLPEFRTAFEVACTALREWSEWGNELLRVLVAALVDKRSALQKALPLTVDVSRLDEQAKHIQQINHILQNHNRAVEKLAESKAENALAVARHFAGRFALDIGLAAFEKVDNERRTRIQRTKALLARHRDEIARLEGQTSTAALGAQKLNEVLSYLLPEGQVAVESIGEHEFRFLRSGRPATRLSDGERTALTFAYFLTSLQANGEDLGGTIVFVDDPISSLDSNHIYAVYSLICDILVNCRQLFVATHNSELFNFLKARWLRGRPKLPAGKQSQAYFVRRLHPANGAVESTLEPLPSLLLKFQSEYEFIFSLLDKFDQTPDPGVQAAYGMPNLLRKFLEAYLGFRNPAVPAWHEKLGLLFDTIPERLEVQKFADDASHLQALGRALRLPEPVPTAKRCVRMTLGALEARDRAHFEGLIKAVRPVP